MSPRPIRVAVVDDQQLIRDGFTLIVEAQPDLEVVLQAGDGSQLVAAVRSGAGMDVALVDIRMPGMDGLSATRELAAFPHAPAVLIVTTFSDDDYVLEALAAGASGFLLKRCSGVELVTAIRSVADGDAVLSPTVTRAVVERLRGRRPIATLTSPNLSERETVVLSLVGAGLNNNEIATRLFLSESTVKTHVSNVLSKTHSRDRVQAALLAHRLGLTDLSSD